MTSVSASHTPVFGIRELAERTGVPQATLRTWEARYGVPRAQRLPKGHRRYCDRDVALIAEALRLRTTGLALPAALERAASSAEQPAESLFAPLRDRHPGVPTRIVSKRSLLVLTRAVEDEVLARAPQPVLFAGFQQARFYRPAADRWQELARTARYAAVFADFGAARRRSGTAPVLVNVQSDAPVRREWFLVCDSPQLPVCVVAWELPAPPGGVDRERRFEMFWSVDARVVRDAATICAALAGWQGHDDDTPPARPSPDLLRVGDLFNRVVAYFDESSEAPARR